MDTRPAACRRDGGGGGGRADPDRLRPALHRGQELQSQLGALDHAECRRVFSDLLTFAIALRDKGVLVPEIARKLTIRADKNAGNNPSVASQYRALDGDAETAMIPGSARAPDRGPGGSHDRERARP